MSEKMWFEDNETGCLIVPIPFVIIHYCKKKKEAQKSPTNNHKYARDIDNQNR